MEDKYDLMGIHMRYVGTLDRKDVFEVCQLSGDSVVDGSCARVLLNGFGKATITFCAEFPREVLDNMLYADSFIHSVGRPTASRVLNAYFRQPSV